MRIVHEYRDMAVEVKALLFVVVVLIIVSIALAIGELRFQQTSSDFHTLKGGLCTLIAKSNKGTQQNKIVLKGQADRAMTRYKIDKANGDITAAQGDLDASRLYERIAKQSVPLPADEFGC